MWFFEANSIFYPANGFWENRKSLFIAEPCSDFNPCYEQRISENHNWVLFKAVSLWFWMIAKNRRPIFKGFNCLYYSQYVNWNKHPVPVPPSSRLIHYELQHSWVTSCRKSWCESCWYSCNCKGQPIKTHFSIDLSNCYSYNHVIMYTCDCQFH